MKKMLLVVFMTLSLFSDCPEDFDAESVCVVFLTDQNYYRKFKKTLKELRTDGCYKGDVCVILTGRLSKRDVEKDSSDERLYIIRFPEIAVSQQLKDNAAIDQNIVAQLQKFHVFQPYFKNWDYVFYIDSGMHIHGDVNKIIALKEQNVLLAHSNCFPSYEWTHLHEFNDDKSSEYQQLLDDYGLDNDYFQSGIMLFDTRLIKEDTANNLIKLKEIYPFGCGDQSYISLYFCHIHPVWRQIQLNDQDTFFYDYHQRFPGSYIMHKYINGPCPCRICEPERCIAGDEDSISNKTYWFLFKERLRTLFGF